MGNSQDPTSLHKYMYANADPVMYTDPTGNFSMGSMMAAINVQARLVTNAIVTYGFRRAIGKALTAAATGTVIGLKYEIKRCIKTKGKKCRIPNLVVIGSDNPESKEHIWDAQTGNGSNGVYISPVVTYKKGANKSRSWLRSTVECKGRTGRLLGKDCDEYPFAASKEGGKQRYKANKVSLRPISSCDNQCAGRVYGRAVRGTKNGTKFVIAPFGPTSFYIRDFKPGL